MPIVLALDVATRAGFACGAVGSTPRFGSVSFSAKGGPGEVLSLWRRWLDEAVTIFSPTVVFVEAPYVPTPREPRFAAAGKTVLQRGAPPMNPEVLRRLLAMFGLVQEIAFERGVPFEERTIQRISQYFTGQARWKGGRDAKKRATVAVAKKLGFAVQDDNAADAVALWCLAEMEIDPVSAARRQAGGGLELPLHGTLPRQDFIGRRVAT